MKISHLGQALLGCIFWWIVLFVCIYYFTHAAKGADVRFSWNPNPETNIAGYVLLGGRSSSNWTVTHPTGNVTNTVVRNLESSSLYYFTIKAVNTAGLESDEAIPITITTRADIPRISRENWKVNASSQETLQEDNRTINCIDGNNQTIWHTLWLSSIAPHSLLIELPKLATISGLWYLPRQDGGTNGIIENCEIETSNNGITWSKATTVQWPATTAEKYVSLPLVECRFVRLWSLGSHASAAEITLDGNYSPQIIKRILQRSTDFTNWTDLHQIDFPLEREFFRIKTIP